MTTKLSVINQALSELSIPPVPNLVPRNANDTAISAAQSIANILDILLPELLLRTDWNFAIKFVQDDTPLSTVISPDYLYNYQLPADYNRLDRFSWQFTMGSYGFYYRIIDNVIMTNSRPILYYYVVNNVDYSVITPLFERTLALYAAARRCVQLTQNAQLAKYLEDQYKETLVNAIRQNDMDRYVQSTPYNDYQRTAYI